jgi:hypothetical protein
LPHALPDVQSIRQVLPATSQLEHWLGHWSVLVSSTQNP